MRQPARFRRVAKSLVLSLLALGCGANKTDTATASSTPNTASTTAASLDDSASADKTASADATNSDSADVFDPDGYYFVKESLPVEGTKVSWLELHTMDYYYGGELHDRPRLVEPPEVFLALEIPNSRKHSRLPCTTALITPDSLSLRCAAPSGSEAKIDGHFLDKHGQYSDKLAYENTPTVLLEARVLVTKDGKVAHDAVHHFTYTSGG